jgi:hypothetical protein
MNYLSHFVYNHEVCGLSVDPHFALGVALPDLWLRFSRKRRIRWKALRAATPGDTTDANLRAGLLNHVEIDRRFHMLPEFLRWQRDLKDAVDVDGVHPALVDFVTHAAIELTMDHHLICDRPELLDTFYGALVECDVADAAARVGRLGAVDTDGLAEVIERFVTRRFLQHYRHAAGLADVVRIVCSLAQIVAPPDRLLHDVFAEAIRRVEPAVVWDALGADVPVRVQPVGVDGSI